MQSKIQDGEDTPTTTSTLRTVPDFHREAKQSLAIFDTPQVDKTLGIKALDNDIDAKQLQDGEETRITTNIPLCTAAAAWRMSRYPTTLQYPEIFKTPTVEG
jgi:hypothetical protein